MFKMNISLLILGSYESCMLKQKPTIDADMKNTDHLHDATGAEERSGASENTPSKRKFGGSFIFCMAPS